MTERPWAADPPWTGDPDWPVADAVIAWENPFFEAGYDRVERPDGERADYYWIDPPDAAMVLAVTDDEEVVVVEQYRPRLRLHVLGLPAGGVDPGEDPEAAAGRELREETGYTADSLSHLDTYVPSGWARYRRHVFVAEGITPGDPDHDEGEFIETDLVPAEELLDVVRERPGPAFGGVLTPLLLAREAGVI
jgi:ADP-ribose pyrophosphatase